MQCKLVTSIARKTFRYYREYCYRQFFFIAVNRWKRNSLPGTQLFLSSRKRERGRERKRTGETGGERPGEKFQTIACKTCAVISSVCRAPYVWFHSQLYNFIIPAEIANCSWTISNWDINWKIPESFISLSQYFE